ncbi:hypothetical protein EDD99_1656 [Streptomyces sp. 846.5]|nr:hypothetical protein [Streptomyces sp. 846.5]TDU03238.1 hypothetical protein EDD99_1656 [Streptomyces sp. 846.5]
MPDISSNRSGSTGTRAAGGSRRAAGRDRGPRQPAVPASSAAPAPRGARAFAVRAAQLSVLALVVLPFALIVGGGLLALVVVLLTNFG